MSDQVVLNCCRNCVKGVLGVPSTNSEYWSVMCVDSNCTCHKLDALTKALEAKAKEPEYKFRWQQMCALHGLAFPSDEKCPKCKPAGWNARKGCGGLPVYYKLNGSNYCVESVNGIEIHPSAQRVRMHMQPYMSDASGNWSTCFYKGVYAAPDCPWREHAEFLQISSESAP